MKIFLVNQDNPLLEGAVFNKRDDTHIANVNDLVQRNVKILTEANIINMSKSQKAMIESSMSITLDDDVQEGITLPGSVVPASVMTAQEQDDSLCKELAMITLRKRELLRQIVDKYASCDNTKRIIHDVETKTRAIIEECGDKTE